jgi:hypothetical protein
VAHNSKVKAMALSPSGRLFTGGQNGQYFDSEMASYIVVTCSLNTLMHVPNLGNQLHMFIHDLFARDRTGSKLGQEPVLLLQH